MAAERDTDVKPDVQDDAQPQEPVAADAEPAANTKLERLEEMRKQSRLGGGEGRIQQQHDKGKLAARTRVNLLLDEGTFEEIDPSSRTGRRILEWQTGRYYPMPW